mgnify:FL=1
MLKIIKKEGKIVINKSDIGNQDGIKKLAQEFNTEIKFNIPYSKEIVDSYSRGEPVKIGNILELIKWIKMN